jgi:hypothetical protein
MHTLLHSFENIAVRFNLEILHISGINYEEYSLEGSWSSFICVGGIPGASAHKGEDFNAKFQFGIVDCEAHVISGWILCEFVWLCQYFEIFPFQQ